MLDGEVCALDEDGRSSFSAMQQGKAGTPFVYYAFDVLEVDGEPLVDLPLVERRKQLEQAARPPEPDGAPLGDLRRRRRRCYEAAQQQGLEGIVAKRAGLALRARAGARATG